VVVDAAGDESITLSILGGGFESSCQGHPSAPINRLLHHTRGVLTFSDRIDLTQAAAGKGVMPRAPRSARTELLATPCVLPGHD
jgi:hypothetical protein